MPPDPCLAEGCVSRAALGCCQFFPASQQLLLWPSSCLKHQEGVLLVRVEGEGGDILYQALSGRSPPSPQGASLAHCQSLRRPLSVCSLQAPWGSKCQVLALTLD